MKIIVEVTPDNLCDLFTTCFEGGYSPWLKSADWIYPTRDALPQDNVVWWGHKEFFQDMFEFGIKFDRPEDEEGAGKGKMIITPGMVSAGLTQATKQCPKIWGRFISEDYDALDADAIVQCIVFGEVIYG